MLRSTMQRVDTDKVTAELQGSVYVHAALAAGCTNTLTNQKHDIYKLDVSNGDMHACSRVLLYGEYGVRGWDCGQTRNRGSNSTTNERSINGKFRGRSDFLIWISLYRAHHWS